MGCLGTFSRFYQQTNAQVSYKPSKHNCNMHLHFTLKYFSPRQSQNLSCYYTPRSPIQRLSSEALFPGPLTLPTSSIDEPNIHKRTKGPLLLMGDTTHHILKICILRRHHNHLLLLSFLEIICILSRSQAANKKGVEGVAAFVLYGPLFTWIYQFSWENCDFLKWMKSNCWLHILFFF